jgi:hypothetical protein
MLFRLAEKCAVLNSTSEVEVGLVKYPLTVHHSLPIAHYHGNLSMSVPQVTPLNNSFVALRRISRDRKDFR